MWKNKSLTALLLAAVLLLGMTVTASAESELISPDQIKTDTVNYSTQVVQRGDITRYENCGTAEFHPLSYRLLYTGKTGVFVQMISSRTGQVKAGEKIAEFKINVDEVAVAEKELKLQRTKEDLARGSASRQEEIMEMMTAREDAPNDYSYQKQTVQIQIKQVELEQFIFQTNSAIADLEAELSELYADREPFYVISPIDGDISDVVYFHEGDVIKTGDPVCTVTDESIKMVRCVDNEFRYGMEAEVSSSKTKGQYELQGHVVMSSAVIPDSQKKFTYIEIDNVDEYTGSWMFLTARVKAVDIQNVLIIPNRARSTDTKDYYVTKLGSTSGRSRSSSPR